MLKQTGFSLIELVVVILVLMIGAAVAIPNYIAITGNAQTKSIAQSIVNGLQVARLEAVKRGQNVKFTLNTGDTSWAVGCETASDQCPETITKKSGAEGGNQNINITLTGGSEAVFSSFGTLSSAANQLEQLDVKNAKLSTSQARVLRVVLDVGGSARLCYADITDTTDPRSCPDA